MSASWATASATPATAQGAAHASCRDDGYLDLFRQDGTAFASEPECHRYAARGAPLVHLKVTETEPWRTVKGQYILTEEAGYGLRPGSAVEKCGTHFEAPDWCWPPRTVAADGSHSATSGMYWDEEWGGWYPESGTFFCWYPAQSPGYLTGIYLVATTASGSPVRSRTIAPTGCGGGIF